jgi:hypothetical protein
MKADSKQESTRLAGIAMRRAARRVLGDAVRSNEAIPLWNGKEVVWKVPMAEIEQMDALDARTSRQ